MADMQEKIKTANKEFLQRALLNIIHIPAAREVLLRELTELLQKRASSNFQVFYPEQKISKPIIISDTSQQWDDWYFGIRSEAIMADIFNYVDPALPSLPTQPVEPPFPTRPTPEAGQTALTALQREDYWFSLIEHKALLKKYKEVKKALNKLSDRIQGSVSVSAFQILRRAEAYQPYHQLKALKQHLALSDHVTLTYPISLF
ncbi:hypothetical protein SLS56_002111 [Neofusicoccum ribis]|uniref:Uncharacterized protein n=1 Tax=Neofusicoccum ribis TaxID=45134 RepID=A0ABR3T586_9PEZI